MDRGGRPAGSPLPSTPQFTCDNKSYRRIGYIFSLGRFAMDSTVEDVPSETPLEDVVTSFFSEI